MDSTNIQDVYNKLISKTIFDEIDGKDCADIISRLKIIKTEYLSSVQTLNIAELNKNSVLIKKQFNNLITALELYLNGFGVKAYNKIKKLLKHPDIKKHLECLSFQQRQEDDLYRLRESEEKLDSKFDLFHIPFNLRHRIDSQRFSIPGFPCLYLGSSLDVCWYEIGKPDLSKTYASLFKPYPGFNNTLKLLNLIYVGYGDQFSEFHIHFENQNKINVKQAYSYFILFPLIAACTMKAINRNSRFKQEYIIPNILTDWLLEQDYFDGIAYKSTLFNSSDKDKMINFVYPAKKLTEVIDTNKNIYNKHLDSIFRFSNPVNLHELKNISFQLLSVKSFETIDEFKAKNSEHIKYQSDLVEIEKKIKYSLFIPLKGKVILERGEKFDPETNTIIHQ